MKLICTFKRSKSKSPSSLKKRGENTKKLLFLLKTYLFFLKQPILFFWCNAKTSNRKTLNFHQTLISSLSTNGIIFETFWVIYLYERKVELSCT